MTTRPDISMSRQEMLTFLGTQRHVVVSALDNGRPTGTIASATLVGDGLAVVIDDGDPVRSLLTVDDRVCVIAEEFPSYYEIKGVSVHGRARFASDGRTFHLSLADVTSFNFSKVPRSGPGSGKDR